MIDLTRHLGARLPALNTAQRILLGYVLISLLGLLALWAIGGADPQTALIDHFFTSVSAVSTTGLTTMTIAEDYSFAGQLVILALIQVGGLGYMTLAAVLVSRFHLRTRSTEEETETDFAIPPEANVLDFARAACIVTLVAEVVGAVILFFAFRAAGVEQPLWNAVFHSISAFCTSGLSLFPDSFESFSGNPFVLLPIGALSILGAIGFLVAWDIGRGLARMQFRLVYTNRVVLLVFLPMLAGATILLYLTDGRLDAFSGSARWLNAFFAAMTGSTTVGFNALPTADLAGAALVLVAATMVIGAAPSGTSGGIKITTTAVLVATMVSSLRQKDHVALFGRRVSPAKVRASATTLVFYCVLMLLATFVLAAIEPQVGLRATFFEVISALGTIGLSYGASADYDGAGKAIVAILMIAGRVGILAFGAALLSGGHDEEQLEEAERV